MSDTVDVQALAKLARLDVAQEELDRLSKELPGILAFVETIQQISVADEKKGTGLHNVLREDTDPHEGGLYTEKLLAAAPAREGNRIAVQQVISRKK